MKASEKSLPTRIFLWSLVIGILVVGFTVYSQYAAEIGQEITIAIAEALPDVDNTIAQR